MRDLEGGTLHFRSDPGSGFALKIRAEALRWVWLEKNGQACARKKWDLRGGTFTWKLLRGFSEQGEHKRDSGSSSGSSKCHLAFQHGEGSGV